MPRLPWGYDYTDLQRGPAPVGGGNLLKRWRGQDRGYTTLFDWVGEEKDSQRGAIEWNNLE